MKTELHRFLGILLQVTGTPTVCLLLKMKRVLIRGLRPRVDGVSKRFVPQIANVHMSWQMAAKNIKNM